MIVARPFADLLDVDERVPLVVHERGDEAFDPADGAIHLAIDRAGTLDVDDLARFDVALTAAEDPPAPWVGLARARLAQLQEAVATAPVAALVLMRVLRIGEGLSFEAALEVEIAGLFDAARRR